MMLPTHALGGMVLGLTVGAIVPEFGGVALVAGFLGGIFPDFDMYAGHRRSLHFPVYYFALAFGTLVLTTLMSSTVTVGVALFFLGAAVHSLTDVFGGGLELRPWEATSDRAVYDHYHGRWIAPRRWISYDGSPGDLLLSIILAVPLLLVLDGVLLGTVVATLTVGMIYTAVRRLLPDVANVLVGDLIIPVFPASLLEHVPDRYLGVSRQSLQHSHSDH